MKKKKKKKNTISAANGCSHWPTWLAAEQDPPCSSHGPSIGRVSCQSAGHEGGFARRSLPASIVTSARQNCLFLSWAPRQTTKVRCYVFVTFYLPLTFIDKVVALAR